MYMNENIDDLKYKIGDEFYLYIYANHFQEIKLVALNSIESKKIRGKNESYKTYTFKYCNDSNFIYDDGTGNDIFTNQFIENDNVGMDINSYLFSKSYSIDKYTSKYYRIYKTDNDFVLRKLSQLKTEKELKENIKVIENFLTEIKNSGVNAPLNTIRQITKIIKYYKYII